YSAVRAGVDRQAHRTEVGGRLGGRLGDGGGAGGRCEEARGGEGSDQEGSLDHGSAPDRRETGVTASPATGSRVMRPRLHPPEGSPVLTPLEVYEAELRRLTEGLACADPWFSEQLARSRTGDADAQRAICGSCLSLVLDIAKREWGPDCPLGILEWVQ